MFSFNLPHTHTTKPQGLIVLINITQRILLSKLIMQSWQILLQTEGLFGYIHQFQNMNSASLHILCVILTQFLVLIIIISKSG